MTGIPSKILRESLLFGAAVALAGLIASFGARVVGNIDTTRDARLLARLSSATSVDASSIEAFYPKTGSRKIFIMKTPSGTRYGTMIALSSPSYSGLVAATFSANGQLDTIKQGASMRSAWLIPGNDGSSEATGQAAPQGNIPTFLTGPSADFDPTGLELARSLTAISQAIAGAAEKEGAK